jgi:antirestriction protein ArdC
MASLPNETTKDKAKRLRATVDANLETLAKAVDTERASAAFKAYLQAQARFHDYSWHNTMLIVSQCPGASRVAGYRTWQKLGRQVRQGERGIMIFAPRTFKKEVETADGETEERAGIYFRPVHVFDIGQTDGEALPEFDVPTVDVAADTLLTQLGRVALSRGLTVDFKADLPAFGSVDRQGHVEIDNSHPTGQQAKTLAHELAHAALHIKSAGERLTRSTAELEAESVAYVVCAHAGVDTEVRSSRYIALWGGDAKGLRASLERIATTAREIIDDIGAASERKAVA